MKIFTYLALATALGLGSKSIQRSEAGTFRGPCEAVIEKDQLALPTRSEWKVIVDHPDVTTVAINRSEFYVQCHPQGDLKPEAYFRGEFDYRAANVFFSMKRRPDRSDPINVVALLSQAVESYEALDVPFRKIQISRRDVSDLEANTILSQMHKRGYELTDFDDSVIEFSRWNPSLEKESIRYSSPTYTKMAELRFSEYEKLLSKAELAKEQEDVLLEFSRTVFDQKFYLGVESDLLNVLSEGTKYDKSLLPKLIKEKFPEVIAPMRKEQARVFKIVESFILKGNAGADVKLKAIDALVQYATSNRLVDYKVAKQFQESVGLMWNDDFFAKQLKASLNRISSNGKNRNAFQKRAKSWLQLIGT